MKRGGYLQRRTPLRARGKSSHARRTRDHEFMSFVHTIPCHARLLAQGFECEGPIEADHVGGRYYKPVDRNCVPMCQKHHRQRHSYNGVFAGWPRERRREWEASAIAETQRLFAGGGG